MISPEAILKITCPTCGAGPNMPCMKGSRGQVLTTQHPSRIRRAIEVRPVQAPLRGGKLAAAGDDYDDAA